MKEDILLRQMTAKGFGHSCPRSDPVSSYDDVDWHLVLQRAREEAVASLVHKALSEEPFVRLSVPDDVRDVLQRAYFSTAALNMTLYRDLAIVLAALNEQGIPAVVLKGPHLAETVYRNVALRPIGDLDILVHLRDIPEIERIAADIGFSPQNSELDRANLHVSDYLNSLVYMKQDTMLHLHWHIVNCTVPVCYTRKIDMESLWKDSEETEIAEVATRVLSPCHLLIHLCEHAFRHSFHTMLRLCDVGAAITEFSDSSLDWQFLLDETVRFGMEKPVYCALSLVSSVFDIPIPEKVRDSLKPRRNGLLERHIDSLAKGGRRLPFLAYLSYLLINESFGDRLRYVVGSLFPPRYVLALRHGVSPSSIGLAHYVRRLSTGSSKGSEAVRGQKKNADTRIEP